MPHIPDSVQNYYTQIRQIDAAGILDLCLIAVLIFVLLSWLKGTSGMSLVRGAAFIAVGAIVLGTVFNLTVVNWLLRNSPVAAAVAVPIVFQPEIRRALERVGRTRVAARRGPRAGDAVLTALAEACGGRDTSMERARVRSWALS